MVSSAKSRSEKVIFLSASIPDADRWDGEFDALEITDAVVSVAREVLSAGRTLMTAAHPTIAPLLLYVAAELGAEGERRVLVYQSAAFDEVLPEATRRFEANGVGRITRTPAVEGEPGDPDLALKSLELMRRRMFLENSLEASVFIGGMRGVVEEYNLVANLHRGVPAFSFGNPGGEARQLAREDRTKSALHERLEDGTVYPAIARDILREIGPY